MSKTGELLQAHAAAVQEQHSNVRGSFALSRLLLRQGRRLQQSIGGDGSYSGAKLRSSGTMDSSDDTHSVNDENISITRESSEKFRRYDYFSALGSFFEFYVTGIKHCCCLTCLRNSISMLFCYKLNLSCLTKWTRPRAPQPPPFCWMRSSERRPMAACSFINRPHAFLVYNVRWSYAGGWKWTNILSKNVIPK